MANLPGAAWSLPLAKIMTPEETRRLLEVAKQNKLRDYRAFAFAANTGLRVSELVHIRKEDILPQGRLRITRRKKKVLNPEIIELSPEFAEVVKSWGTDGEGWLFPGSARPCQIVRRPKFLEETCPDCGKQIADLNIYRKQGDLKRHFINHLVDVHGREAGEVVEWIDFMAESKVETICGGGHISTRSLQKRWELARAGAQLNVKGRGIHSLRHGYAIQMYQATNNLRATQTALGHSSSVITERYASVTDMRAHLGKMGVML